MAENYITCVEEKGTINISDDVIATMVKIAVKEVDGVAGMAITAGPAVSDLLSKKTASKGVKVSRAAALWRNRQQPTQNRRKRAARGSTS